MLATVTVCIFGTSGAKIPVGRLYVTERPGGGSGGRVFLRWSLRLRHLAFHRKYLFYGRWHGALTLAAAPSRPPATENCICKWTKKFVCYARSNKRAFYYIIF